MGEALKKPTRSQAQEKGILVSLAAMQHLLTKLKALFFFLALGVCMRVVAQKSLTFESISTSQGLSQGMVYCMLQDHDGFIWIGTKEGLNRYDGYNFTVFTNDPYNPHSLSGNSVLALSEDSKGRIWVCTENAGICVYDKITGKFHRLALENTENKGSGIKKVTFPVYELSDGRYLAGIVNVGITIFSLPDDFFSNNEPITFQWLPHPNTTGLVGLARNLGGQVYLSYSDHSLFLFHPDNMAFEKLPNHLMLSGFPNADSSLWISGRPALIKGNQVFPVFDRPPMDSVRNVDILEYPKNRLWLGNWDLVTCHDISKWQPGKPIDLDQSTLYTSNLIGSKGLLLDRSGNLWQGRQGLGLGKLVLSAFRFKQLAKGTSVRNILPLAGDSLLLGTWIKNQYLNTEDKNLQPPGFAREYDDDFFSNYLVAKNGDSWKHPFSKDYVLHYSRTTHTITTYALPVALIDADDNQPVLEDSKGGIWFSGLGGKLVRINPATGKARLYQLKDGAGKQFNYNILSTALYQDGNGVFWMGTTLGFARLDFDGNFDRVPVITWFGNNVADRNSLSYNHVSCFLDDPTDKNFIWIATKGGGLNQLSKITGNFFQLTTKDGLPNDVVYSLLPDSMGNIWGSTNKGIFCLLAHKTNDDKTWQFRNFSKADGLQGDEFNTGAYASLPGGNLAFGGVNGVTIFNPSEILDAGFQPRVFITSILVGNQPVLPNDGSGILKQTIEYASSIHLTHLQDILTLEFSALDFTAPAQNKYRYQMAGLDKDWVESGTRRTATYLHLPAGKYVFKVQGSNSQGVWSSHIAELQITVLPPWWRSWWAYLLYALLFAFGIWGYFKFHINRTKLQAQLNFEQREAKRIKELDTVKTQLYTNITHEFRTPLTVIIGMAQQVKADPKAHLANGMEMIVRNGQNLLNLVNEMLDLSKLETGKMQLQLVKGDVVNFIRYIVESFHSLAESQHKQLHLLAEMDELHLLYDPEKVRQILSNLLSNALKFTPEKGNIYVSINMGPDLADEAYSQLVIKVKDTGIGISEDQIEHIFDRFYQLNNSPKNKTDGTGIGLALTKELVKLMNGEITVKSPPIGTNKGAEFTVMLPLQRVAGEEEPIQKPIPEQAILPLSSTTTSAAATHKIEIKQKTQRALILLVEDNPDVVAYTASCLPDYRLAVGKDGAEGYEIAAELIPDLIITDVMMPFVDGFELCRKLRKDEHTSHIPIIMLTAKADLESKIVGLQHGADVYLEKPFNREELLIRIQKLLELRKKLQEYYLKKAGLAVSQKATEKTKAKNIVLPNKDTEDAFVKKVREAVELHLSEADFSIDQLCKLLFMSHSQLHRKLDALTGCTPNKFIRMIRLNKAREILMSRSESIISIAMDCGFNDAGYFTRVFKQEFGFTPQEWRTNNS